MNKQKDICIICASSGIFDKISSRLRDSKYHAVIQCRSCNHVQISPIPSAEEDKKFYNQNRQPKNIGMPTDLAYLRAKKKYGMTRMSKIIAERFPRGSRLLDVGSSYGLFLEKMRIKGYDVTGIEISREQRMRAKKITGSSILNINLLESTADIGFFDVVTMIHVLEHISQPITFCSILKKYLAKKGCVIAEVPNIDGLMLTASPYYRSFFWQRAHISYFSVDTLTDVFHKAGYPDVEILGIQRYGIENMIHWLTRGKPQIESPKLEIANSYKWLEKYYRSYLEKNFRCDTLIAIGYGA